MKNLIKISALALLAFAAYAPVSVAREPKIVIRKYYKQGEGTVYFRKGDKDDTFTVTETAPATTITDFGGLVISNPVQKTTTSIYVNGQLVGQTTKVRELGLEQGTYKVELRDKDGNVIWTDPSLHVTQHETTVVYPQ